MASHFIPNGSLLTRGVQPCMDGYRSQPQRPQNTVTWCMCHVLYYQSQNPLKYHVAFEGSQQRSGSTNLQAMKYLLLTAKDFVGHDLTVARSDWVGWSWRWLDSKRLFGEMWRLYTSLIWLVYTHITYMSPRLLMSLRLRKPHEATFTFNI